MRPAVFLDRDGTLVHPRHYPSTPDELVLYDGIVDELLRLQDAGFALIIVTNQAGIARGYLTLDDLDLMHADLIHRLEASGVDIDGVFFCPHHQDGSIPELAIACDCRKPEPGMLLRAADELDIDLARSWMVGDILDDIQAGNTAGCRTILVDLQTEELPEHAMREPDFVARDTIHALKIVASEHGLDVYDDLTYRPARWRVPARVQVS